MAFITEWVTQIIVFILIGTIIELLIPNNAMKKYINIVVGLLLLVILAKPILYIFQVDVSSELSKFEQSLFNTNQQLSQTENLVELQKKEIQAEQDAYIWNEVKSQLINEANPTLHEEYDAQISDLSFVFNDEMLDNFDNLEKIVVTMKSTSETGQDEEWIEPVHIDMSEPHPQSKFQENNRIRTTLENKWGLNKEQIQVIWEGGDPTS